VVSYTHDWAEDAQRRDFTMNALSADREGNVFDYTDGLADLDAGHVRFIGTAADRIREDHLRILRFFRFQATYGKTEPDPEALVACRAAVANLENLSGERLWQEFSRILAAAEPNGVLALMEKAHVLSCLLPVRRRLAPVRALVALEDSVRRSPDPILRLAALVQARQREMSQIAARFRLSRADTKRLLELNAERGNTRPGMPELAVRRSLYALGPDFFGDLVLLDWAEAIVANAAGAAEEAVSWKQVWDSIGSWSRPGFPIGGEDALSMGVPKGPEVGEFVREVENWWVDQAFRPDRETCLDRLRRIAYRRGYRP
ncbi:MAG: CCA tRNA nucleotidyltransferase, partial [Rhodospirillaceae bacterium]